MKEEKTTAVMLILLGFAGLCLLIVIGIEICDGVAGLKMVNRMLESSAPSLKYLLKYNPLQQWVAVAFGGFLIFTGLTIMAWVNQKRL